MEDVTERQRLEQERDRNYAFLSQILDHIPSQITVKDARERRYLLANSVAEAQFGVSREEIVGKTADELFPKKSAEIITADDDKMLQADGLFKDEHLWESQALGKRYITSTRIGIRDNTGEIRYLVNVVNDVTERRRADEKIAHLAHYDALTDLPNRVLFREQIERELQKVGARRAVRAALYRRRRIQGHQRSLGHHVGDELLKAVAGRIRGCVREADLIARLGGDEFAVIQTGDQGTTPTCVEIVTRSSKRCASPISASATAVDRRQHRHRAGAEDGTDLDQLIKHADLAMYGAKADGRRTYASSSRRWTPAPRRGWRMELDLRQALADGGFELHYQPLVDLRTDDGDRLRGAAALAPSGPRHDLAGRIHPGGGGHRTDRRNRRMGAAHRLRRGRDLA